ncbi:MAG: DUF2283 domain-containing protein [Phycisphaerales bacterium]|nr:DUF2283 domain-containing protein [Phycisphaerales bacterium]
MVASLTVKYDAEGDILYLGKTPPYAGQESTELDYGLIARLNPTSRDVENLEILFFSTRMKDGQGVDLPVLADFRLPKTA